MSSLIEMMNRRIVQVVEQLQTIRKPFATFGCKFEVGNWQRDVYVYMSDDIC